MLYKYNFNTGYQGSDHISELNFAYAVKHEMKVKYHNRAD